MNRQGLSTQRPWDDFIRFKLTWWSVRHSPHSVWANPDITQRKTLGKFVSGVVLPRGVSAEVLPSPTLSKHIMWYVQYKIYYKQKGWHHGANWGRRKRPPSETQFPVCDLEDVCRHSFIPLTLFNHLPIRSCGLTHLSHNLILLLLTSFPVPPVSSASDAPLKGRGGGAPWRCLGPSRCLIRMDEEGLACQRCVLGHRQLSPTPAC